MTTPFIAPDNPLGYPAPYWFLVFFKVLGFILHVIPMNLWYAGLILMLLLRRFGSRHAQHLAQRTLNAMPVIVALGINFGIVPLLFTQVAYYKVFYPATILTAWHWFSIIPLLTLAYYGVYLHVTGLRDARLTPLRRAAGWVAAVLFIAIGLLFANGFSLMTNLKGWPDLWRATSIAAAPLGTAFNSIDPTFWPRWLLMFGLAITTTAAYVLVDAAFFARSQPADYKTFTATLALKLYTLGAAWFALAGSWYTFLTWPAENRQIMFTPPLLLLTLATALSPGLPWLLMLAQSRRAETLSRPLALLAGLAQVAVLALNAVSRQVLQNIELAPHLDVTAEKVNLQLGPMIVFLALFVVGLAVVLWMLAKVLGSARQSTSPSG